MHERHRQLVSGPWDSQAEIDMMLEIEELAAQQEAARRRRSEQQSEAAADDLESMLAEAADDLKSRLAEERKAHEEAVRQSGNK